MTRLTTMVDPPKRRAFGGQIYARRATSKDRETATALAVSNLASTIDALRRFVDRIPTDQSLETMSSRDLADLIDRISKLSTALKARLKIALETAERTEPGGPDYPRNEEALQIFRMPGTSRTAMAQKLGISLRDAQKIVAGFHKRGIH